MTSDFEITLKVPKLHDIELLKILLIGIHLLQECKDSKCDCAHFSQKMG